MPKSSEAMAGSEPLLSNRASSELSNDALAEEDALLSGEATARRGSVGRYNWRLWREVGLFSWAFIATILVIVLAVVYEKDSSTRQAGKPTGKRNLIFMVSDGMGPTSLALTRSFRQNRDNLPVGDTLVLDKYLIGQSRTRSSSSLVTDSAAGATAFSCGFKSYNGAISVLPDYSPCGTVMEAAKKAGYMTGLVVTTRITDATPAVFVAHVNMRTEEDRIAEQMIGEHPLGHVVDLMLGGGRCHFLPNTTAGTCRADDRDIVGLAREKGYDYVSDRKSFDALKLGDAVKLPLLGLFAETDIPYEIDRRNENDIYPSLDEMAITAMKALSLATKDSDKGFFLMIEGSRIDHAGHANDPAAQVHEVLAYDKAFASVLDFLENDSVQGLMVSTSDHETGGLAVARQLHPAYPDYLWYPDALVNTSHSAERLSQNYFHYLQDDPSGNHTAYIESALTDGLGVQDASSTEIQLLVDSPQLAPYTFADIISRRAQTGWSTHGHSGADVNIFASSREGAKGLVGNHENTDVGKFLASYLDVQVEPITEELKAKGPMFDSVDVSGQKVSWQGKLPANGERLDGQDHMDHYQGDFKKHRRCDICGL